MSFSGLIPLPVGINDTFYRRLTAVSAYNSDLPLAWASQGDSDAHIVLPIQPSSLQEYNGETFFIPLIEVLGTKLFGILRKDGFVVKFARSRPMIEKLQREFICYAYLQSQGVTCIPVVLGLFETKTSMDQRFKSVVLIVEHAGAGITKGGGGAYDGIVWV